MYKNDGSFRLIPNRRAHNCRLLSLISGNPNLAANATWSTSGLNTAGTGAGIEEGVAPIGWIGEGAAPFGIASESTEGTCGAALVFFFFFFFVAVLDAPPSPVLDAGAGIEGAFTYWLAFFLHIAAAAAKSYAGLWTMPAASPP
jgi:hypothetical protein